MLRRLGFSTFLMWLLSVVPAWADTSVHASGYLGPLVAIIVVAVLATVALWAIHYWEAELNKISPLLVKILRFVVIIVAVILIIVIIAGMAGVHIT